jgi:hypothetical protein
MASRPAQLRGDVFVATLTSTILRYNKSGSSFGPGGSYWSTFSLASLVGVNPLISLLFDSSGNLYVATDYGTSGYQVEIFKYSASQLLTKKPVPSGAPIITTAGRGDQMAWDVFGNIHGPGSWIHQVRQRYPASGRRYKSGDGDADPRSRSGNNHTRARHAAWRR